MAKHQYSDGTMIRIEATDREVLKALDRLFAAVAAPSEAMEEIGRTLANMAEDAFQTETDPWGRPWEQLSEATFARRRGKDGHRILQDTGLLASSITWASGRDWAEVGAGRIYAAIHQFGGQAGRGKKTTITARAYLPFNEQGELPPGVQTEVLDIVREHLESAATGN